MKLNPAYEEEISDPVYRKINKALNYSYDPKSTNPYYPFAGLISDYVNEIQIRIERREMREDEYNYLNESSVDKLLSEWSKEIKSSIKAS
jgi:hypothetical protein